MDPKYCTVVQKSRKFSMSTDSHSELTAFNSILVLSSGDKLIAGQYIIDLDYIQKAKVMFDAPIAVLETAKPNQILTLLHRMNKVQIRKYDFSQEGTGIPIVSDAR